MTEEVWDTPKLEQHLTQAGEKLSDNLRNRIIAQGKAIVPALLDVLNNEGIETELYQLAGKKIQGCTACMQCFENRNKRCSIETDVLNECLEKMLAADGIILGSPTYFTDVTAEMKGLIDRAGFVS